MKHVTFQNDGLIDLRAVKTFGVNSKENKNPIGYFGTGLKYAIAVALRNDCTVEMWIGNEYFTFFVVPTEIRVDKFNIIVLQRHDPTLAGGVYNEELAFTTELGRNWEPWQAMREFWCNAIDEDGDMYAGKLRPEHDATTFVVSGKAIVDAYYERENVMLRGEPKWQFSGIDIHYKRSRHMYFRGVRVGDLAKSAMLTYNVTGHGMELTEDRTLKYPHMVGYYVKEAIGNCDSEELLREIIEAPKESWEGTLDFSDTEPGPLLMRMLEDTDFRSVRNNSLLVMYRKAKGFSIKPADIKLDDNEEKQLKKAIAFCEAIGYEVTNYPIHITDDLEDHILGRAYDGAIFINRRTFMRGTKLVAGTILEEYIHLQYRLSDESRGFQDFLIDSLVTLGEKYLGEPL